MHNVRLVKFAASGFSLFLLVMLAACCTACALASPSDSTSLIAELDERIPAVIAAGNAPSTQVAVIYNGQVIWSRAYGADTGVDHVYMNASVQKMFTATAVLRLADQGLIDLDADVSDYVPFTVRHPEFPDTPITPRMLLAHRSGLDSFPQQFNWDTASVFAPLYRQPCPTGLQTMTHEEFMIASLTPEGINYDEQAWIGTPGKQYCYSVSAYPFLRYVTAQVAGQSYAEYMHENVFLPLEMGGSGFSSAQFAGRHTTPYVRIDGDNIELPVYDGQASMMHTTAADIANFQIALMNDGRFGEYQLLQPETVELMARRITRFKTLFKGGPDLPRAGHGLGLYTFIGGWRGYGGSAPGYQCLSRYHPGRQVGYVILTNVNAILSGGKNYESARGEIYNVQNELIAILDPAFPVRSRILEFLIISAWFLFSIGWILLNVRRRRKKLKQQAVNKPESEQLPE